MQIAASAAEGIKSDVSAPSLVDTLVNVVPVNPFGAIGQGTVLPAIFFCLLFGIALAYARNSEDEQIQKSGETVFLFFNGGAEIMYMVVHWILQYAPIGVFALIADVFGKQTQCNVGFTKISVGQRSSLELTTCDVLSAKIPAGKVIAIEE